MSMLQQAPQYDAAEASRLARTLYGVDAEASSLPSERDQNFLLTTRQGERYVLKIANATEARDMLDAQNAALEHAAAIGLGPRVLAAGGERIPQTSSGHLVRLLSWIPGAPMATVETRPPALLEDLGRALGRLDRRLEGFDHPAIHRQFYWDLAQAFGIIDLYAPLIADPAWRALVERIAGRVRARDGDRQAELRRSTIHGDANDFNVLVVTDEDGAARVSGLIDFGDMVHSFTVAEPAVAIAYAVLDHADPVAAAASLTRGYHAEHPLTLVELDVLFGLVQLRLCASACIAAHQQVQRPADAYLSISQAPIQRTLPALAAIHPDAAADALREACGLASGRPAPAPVPRAVTLDERRRRFGANLSLAYHEPLKVTRGWMQYLFDEHGARHLDAYNNVPHAGHSHPRIVRAIAEQTRALSTNTRYLHDTLWRFAERLTATLPPGLEVCYFVNSGSEANELALRLARAFTGARDLVVLDAAYHGNTTTLIDISPYKFDGPGGAGRPDWVHVAPIPDDYRGEYKRTDPDAGRKYGDEVGRIVAGLRNDGRRLAGFICETCPSVGGQIVPPAGYLATAYRHVREAGGVCIADEVQTAYGRMGGSFYAFESLGVVPDIVVLGKPIGNGYPLGAVVTSRAIADAFANGMEFFSTFGGSTVSCAAGLATLETVLDERLQEHAARVGMRLRDALTDLASRHRIIGDIRGSGLFLGVELVRNRETLEPATRETSAVVDGMRDRGILLGSEGPYHNVLKIRPPMPFDERDADQLVTTLDEVLHGLSVATPLDVRP